MAVDKNLFLYDLAVVAIMKNEAPYVKEWLDYHLAAGVDHFYIYDNESPDNFKEVLQPYIDAGIVTYKFFPGVGRQIEAYIEAFKAYRFFCRYMAFIDADEFIFPQNTNKSIVEVTDEILNSVQDSAALEIQWMMYGSNNLETADYSKGVLERFTRRAVNCGSGVKTIANPRRIKYLTTPHYMEYFPGTEVVTESNSEKKYAVSDKILINHYRLKSREEFLNKNNDFKGDVAYGDKNYYSESRFSHAENNDVFDNSILAYRDARRKMGGGTGKPLDYKKLINALIENLAPMISKKELPLNFFTGKMETFLTCQALVTFLKGNLLDDVRGSVLEELTLNAVFKSSLTGLPFADAELLLSELPNFLPLPYETVEDIRLGCLQIIPQLKDTLRVKIDNASKFLYWRDFNDFDNLYRILNAFKK